MFWFPCNSLSCNTHQKERASEYILLAHIIIQIWKSVAHSGCSLLRPCGMAVHYSTGYIKCLSKHGSNTTMIILLCFKILSPLTIASAKPQPIPSTLVLTVYDRLPLFEYRFANNICNPCASSR